MSKDEVKQVIVIRKDLKMRKGKFVSQACHSSLAVVLNAMEKSDNEYHFKFESGSYWDQWLNGRFSKICVYCESEEELLELHRLAEANDIPTVLITDAGLTEFGGVPTKTCIAIGPYRSDKIDKITGHLKLL